MCQKCSKFMLKNLSQSWLKQIASEYIYLVFYHICLTHKPSLGTYLISDSVYFWDSVYAHLTTAAYQPLRHNTPAKLSTKTALPKYRNSSELQYVCMYHGAMEMTRQRFDLMLNESTVLHSVPYLPWRRVRL